MPTGLRVVAGLLGFLFLMNGLQWWFDPASSAQSLGLTLPGGGIGRSTMIGDMGAFFLGAGGLVLAGAASGRAGPLRASALFFGLAAIGRTHAWAFQGAELATFFIAVEVVTAGILLFVASRAGAG